MQEGGQRPVPGPRAGRDMSRFLARLLAAAPPVCVVSDRGAGPPRRRWGLWGTMAGGIMQGPGRRPTELWVPCVEGHGGWWLVVSVDIGCGG